MRLAMTLLVRDAADIIETNIRYHAAQGVDVFVIADHESQDDTYKILRRYEDSGLVHLDRIEGPPQEIWLEGRTALARRAHELGADWVIHDDQDEFWWSLTGDLKDALAPIPERYGLVVAPRADFAARVGSDPWPERLIYREARFMRPPKVAHRAHPSVVLDHPHPTRVVLEHSSDDVFHGRSGISYSFVDAAERGENATPGFVFAPTFPLRIMHFPVRSFEQYRSRIELSERLGMTESKRGAELREALEGNRLEEIYSKMALTDEQVADAIRSGSQAEDTDFRDYLAACSDPLEGAEPPPGARAWSEERRRRELDELQFDAMFSIARYVRRRGGGRGVKVSRIRQLGAEISQLRRQVRQLERERTPAGRRLWRALRRRRGRARTGSGGG